MSKRYSPIWELTLSRYREFVRQPEAVFWVFAFPLLLALALGFAFRERPPEKIPVGVVSGPDATRVRNSLATSPALLPRIYDLGRGKEALRTGKISLLVFPGPTVSYRFDATRPDSRSARLEADSALQSAAGRKNPIATRDEKVIERGSRYIDFLIPGLLGMNLMGTGMWGIGFSIVTARSQKLLKRLAATPMRRSHYMLSHMLSRLMFLVLEVGVLLLFGWWAFGVAIRGSVILLSLVCLLGAAAFSGLGLLIASRVETIEGVSGLMNFVMMPMWLLSGVFFSAERFPDYAQPFIRLLPLTALNDALRAVMLEAKPIGAIAPEVTNLVLWSAGTFLIALRIFKWR